MSTAATPVIIAPGPDLVAFLKTALRELREEDERQGMDRAQCLSANQVARLARKRNDLVGTALRSGALRATRYGSNPDHPRYAITKADAVSWIEAGCPEVLAPNRAAG